MRRLIAALALPLAVADCGGARAPEAPPAPRMSEADLERLVADLSAQRGLARRAPIPIHRLDERRFVELLRSKTDDGPADPDDDAASAGLLLGFDLLPEARPGPPGKGKTATVDAVLEEQVAAFYDDETREVFVREAAAGKRSGDLEDRLLLAHEVEHALQHQNFGSFPMAVDASTDRTLARRAVLEGDAMFAMVLYGAHTERIPAARAMRRAIDYSRKVPVERLRESESESPVLDRALPLVRERLLFPYFGGLTFMAELYRAGGLALANKVFETPPTTTSQVLHPDKWVRGEAGVPVASPEPPPGYRVVARNHMGELQTRVILEKCSPHEVARSAAEGWAGDAFTIAVDPSGRLALLWSSAWDTAEDAEEFELALSRSEGCWHAGALDMGGGTWRAGARHAWLRSGKNVAFVRGPDEPLLGATAKQILSAPQPPAPEPKPIGSYSIVPAAPLPEPTRSVVNGLVYSSEWLGLAARLPTGMSVSIGTESFELLMTRPGTPIAGGLVISDRLSTSRSIDEELDTIAEQLRSRVFPELSLVQAAGGDFALPLGRARAKTWYVAGTPVEIQAVVLPICNATGELFFLQMSGDGFAKGVLDQWLFSFHRTTDSPPVCGLLDPE